LIQVNVNTLHEGYIILMIPVTIQANGTISKSFRKYLSDIPGKHEIKELQKTAILGTAHILCKILMKKYNTADLTMKLASHAPWTATAEQLQYHIP
jgi:hypothetical protein